VTLNDHFVLSSTCDENLLSLANDEFDLAQERETEGVKEMTESDQIVSKAFTSTVASLGAEQVVEKALIKGIEALASEGTATLYEIGGTVVTLQNIETKEIPELRNEYRESRNLRDQADKDFAFADKADKVARKDLDDALAQGPCIGSAEDELNKLEKEQALQQQIQKKVDSWRAAGSRDMYVVNGQLTDVAGATAAAKAALTGNGRSLQAVSTERLSVKASASQLKAALAGVKRALAACARVKTKLASYKQTTTATIARIRALLRS
jgi:hypothetical protein